VITAEQRTHDHAFPCAPNSEDVTGPCGCGMTFERYCQLQQEEAAGRRYAFETTGPIDQYGRAAARMGPGVLHGQVIITWPRHCEGQVPGAAEVMLTNALTGKPITALSMRLDVSWGDSRALVAELTMCRDAADPGMPAKAGAPVALRSDGAPELGAFRFLVSEMRVAE
jgi:hypothetical protein